jgi:holliday junction DNA helicase RuvB
VDSGVDGRRRGPLEPQVEGDEAELEVSLRPRRLEDFVGQARTKEHLSIILQAARQRGEPADHLLFAGSPGLGKTTLAHIVAAEMDSRLHTISGPALDQKRDLAAILTGLEDRDVLFVDEIHRLNRAVEEILYPAMEDGAIDLVVGQGPGARTLRLTLQPFTLVGATTRASLLTKPLRDRFGISFRLEHYAVDDLVRIVHRSAGILGVAIVPAGAHEIARRARGTPRVANRLLRRVRDYAQVRGDGTIDEPTAHAALELFGVDQEGLERLDRELLRSIAEKYGGGPVGVGTLAAALGEEPDTIEYVYEPYLLQLGFIQRTPRGRTITALGRAHLGESPRAEGDTRLF